MTDVVAAPSIHAMAPFAGSARPATLSQAIGLDALSPGAQREIEGLSQLRRIASGRKVARQGEVPAHWVAVMSGAICLRATTLDGKSVAIAMLGPGDWLCVPSTIDGEAELCDADAFCDSIVLTIGRPALLPLLQRYPDVGVAFARTQASAHRYLVNSLVALLASDLEQRVAFQLLRLAARFGSPDGAAVRISLRITQEELAGFVGVSRQRVNQCLASMRRRGLVSHEAGHFTIASITTLERSLRTHS